MADLVYSDGGPGPASKLYKIVVDVEAQGDSPWLAHWMCSPAYYWHPEGGWVPAVSDIHGEIYMSGWLGLIDEADVPQAQADIAAKHAQYQ